MNVLGVFCVVVLFDNERLSTLPEMRPFNEEKIKKEVLTHLALKDSRIFKQ